MFIRSVRLWLCFALYIGTAFSQGRAKGTAPASIKVPLIYEEPAAGTAELSLDYGAPYDPDKPTVLVIADGQQFYVRPGAMKELQESTFDGSVNVVGIVTRGTTPAFVSAAVGHDGKPDWLKAWKIFNSGEWQRDIDSVRKVLVGEHGKINLYGRSGGAYLVHQYLSKHPDTVDRAFTQSAVNPSLNAELGISLDQFWSELGRQDSSLQTQLLAALQAHPQERIDILMTLQRQHFFVAADKIASARSALIHSLAAGDMAAFRAARKEYQVDDMKEMYASNDIIPQDVRVLELIAPSGAFDQLHSGIYPLIESQAYEIKPLLDMLRAGAIVLPQFDFTALHHSATEVFLLAGRYDEAVDYRTEIALAYNYPKHLLFIADDNHVFSAMSSNGTSKNLISSFFTGGFSSLEFITAQRNAERYRWSEK
jgi:pimeloyl-ACP methyl ester carboxylesterase